MSYSLNALYQIAGLSKQAVYQYRVNQEKWSTKVANLLIEVDVLRAEHPGCGVEKMYYTLRPDFIGRDRFIDLMMDMGYRVKRAKNYIRTTIPAHYKYPNYIEGSIVTNINQVWQSDITYILIGSTYHYLVFIIDVYSRRIVGYQASNHMRAQANINALKQAIKLRSKKSLSDLIHHSDRGSQYISKGYTDLLVKVGANISMGLKATDNSYAERVNGIIKNEYLRYRNITTLDQLKRQLRRAVNHYNKKRTHKGLPGRISPSNFEDKLLHLEDQKRPKVTIYTEGYDKIKEASNLLSLIPEKNLGKHICPIFYDNYYLTETVNSNQG